MKIIYKDKEIVVVKQNTFIKRFMGIMFRRKKIDYALWFDRCNSIHTFFCRQDIQVIMTDKSDKILYVNNCLGRGKIVIKKGCYNVYEMPPDYFSNVKVNDYIEKRK